AVAWLRWASARSCWWPSRCSAAATAWSAGVEAAAGTAARTPTSTRSTAVRRVTSFPRVLVNAVAAVEGRRQEREVGRDALVVHVNAVADAVVDVVLA